MRALGAEPDVLSEVTKRVASGDLSLVPGARQAPAGSVLASMGEIAARPSQRLLTVSIDNAQKVADHVSESFAHAEPDDVVVLLYTSDETRMAALAVLGLCDG